MSYFNTTFSHLKVRAIRYGVEASLRRSIEKRAASKGLQVKKSKVISITYNSDFSIR